MAVVVKAILSEEGHLCLAMDTGAPCTLVDDAFDALWFSLIQAESLAQALEVPLERSNG